MRIFKTLTSVLCLALLMVSFAVPTYAAVNVENIKRITTPEHVHFKYIKNDSNYVKGYVTWKSPHPRECKEYEFYCNRKTEKVKFKGRDKLHRSKTLTFKKMKQPYKVKMKVRAVSLVKVNGKTQKVYSPWASHTIQVKK